MLERDLLGEVTPAQVAEQTGISQDRIEQLLDRADSPDLYELSRIADALAINPMYLTRPRPSIVARRDSGIDRADLNDFLERYDYHVSAYRQELGAQALDEAFPANSSRGARAHGESWATRNNATWAGAEAPDPLLTAIEQQLRIPVLIWPIPDAPFGATLRLDDTLAIWVNSHDVSGAQQRFTIAHELGHIMLCHTRESRIERTTTPAEAERRGTAVQQTEEIYANAFAGGVLYDYDRVQELWDQELTPASIAKVALGLGISYAAASVAMGIHLGNQAQGIRETANRSTAHAAFEEVGASGLFETLERQRNQKRVPDVVEHSDLLAESLGQTAPR